MKVVLTRLALRNCLHMLQFVLFSAAIFALGAYGLELFSMRQAQERGIADLERQIRHQEARLAKWKTTVSAPRIMDSGTLVGRIQIARLGLSAIVVAGTGKATLRRAAGHIENTALPGQLGNIGIAGHRDSFFRPLRQVLLQDVITLTTPQGHFRYRVVSTRVVAPTELWVLSPTTTEVLTLVTCYPFSYVGAAPDRFIVRAERML